MDDKEVEEENSLDIDEAYDEIWKVLSRCRANIFEIIGVLSKISMEINTLSDEFMREEEEGIDSEGADEDPYVGDQESHGTLPGGVGMKKEDVMFG